MGKHLVCLVDGTMVSAGHRNPYQGYSNVYELTYILQLRDESKDGNPQIVFYTSGISSQPDTKDLLNAATGQSIRSQIIDQYINICSNYDLEAHQRDPESADKIYMFGFSRGAMAIRALAGLITTHGLLRPEDIRHAPKVISTWEQNRSQPSDIDLLKVKVEFIGLFDSVMGGIERLKAFNPIRFPNHALSENCTTGIHIMAIDENRRFFKSKPWTAHNLDQQVGRMRQIWMPGTHSDVGGTGGEFWGRTALLTMLHYIQSSTALNIDKSVIARKQDRVITDYKNGGYAIQQHRRPSFLSTRRVPGGSSAHNEERHPINTLIKSDFAYNGSTKFDWHRERHDPHFSRMTADLGLESYFAGFMT